MGIKFNPLIFSGLDFSGGGGVTTFKPPVANAAALPTASNSPGDVRVTLDTDEIWVWDATGSRWENQQIQASAAIGSTPNAAAHSIVVNETIADLRTNELVLQPADSTNPGLVTIAAQSFAGNKTFDNDVIITGDLTINGTTTTVNTATLEVTDANILVNDGGNQASADSQDAGITVEMSDATDATIGYDSTVASRFRIGEIGSTLEILSTGHTQTVTNKSIDADSNTITNIDNADIKASAGIDATKIADGSVTDTEFQFINTVTSNVQTQLDNKQPLDATLTSLAAFNTNGILTQTAADTFAGRTIVDAGSNKVTVTNGDGVSGNPTLDVNEANVDHDALSNFVSDEHIAHSGVDITTAADSGLSGGGDITASRTLVVDIAGTTEETVVANDDEILINDVSGPARRKMTRANFMGSAAPSAGDLSEASFALAESAAAASVTGLTFANGTVRGAKIDYTIIIDATADLFEKGELEIVQRGADWVISRETTGDDSLIDFDINSSGQVTYDSTTYAGFVSGTMKFRAISLGV